MFKHLTNWINNPEYLILSLENHGLLKFISDRKMIEYVYRVQLHKRLNLDNPVTFNEKIQWLKLHDRKRDYTTMADKLAAKEYVANIIGAEYIVPTLAVWENASDINIEELPAKFVLKVNHDSGGVMICKDKSSIDLKEIRKFFRKKLRHNLFYGGREWPYKDIEPRVFAERFLENEGVDTLVVYKFFCFNGKPELIQVIQDDKTTSETIDYFDIEWNLLPFKQNHPNSISHLDKPQLLGEMINLTRKLMIDIPFIRVDWYIEGDRVFFSEFTFYSDNGFAPFYPDEWDEKLGDMIIINKGK